MGVISISCTLCILFFTLCISFFRYNFVKVELLASLVIWLCFTKWLIELICITHGIADIRCLIIHPFIRNLLLSFNEEVMQNNTCIDNFQNVRQILFLSQLFHNHLYTMQPAKPAFPHTSHMLRFNPWLQ